MPRITEAEQIGDEAIDATPDDFVVARLERHDAGIAGFQLQGAVGARLAEDDGDHAVAPHVVEQGGARPRAGGVDRDAAGDEGGRFGVEDDGRLEHDS